MDKATSVLAKLKNKSKTTGKPLQLYLQLFCQEEFLRKVSLSKYANNLVLKGGLFIYTLTNFESRATIDVDFLIRQLPNSVEDIEKVVAEILATDTGNDFITLTAKSFESISPQRKYTGVSFQIIGQIKNTKTPFSVDFGVGDVIVPNSVKRLIPVQLDEFDNPQINTYSLESTIAEKFDAILSRLEMTSRMKDFYDVYYLSNMFEFDGRKLQEAIYETLQNRGTSYEKESLTIVENFANDNSMVTKWNRWLKEIGNPQLDFKTVIDSIVKFLFPVWQAIINEDECFMIWNKDIADWK